MNKLALMPTCRNEDSGERASGTVNEKLLISRFVDRIQMNMSLRNDHLQLSVATLLIDGTTK